MKKRLQCRMRLADLSLLGLAFLLLPMGTFAFDLSPDSTRYLADPSYLPLGGQFFGSTEFIDGNTTSNTQDNLGNPKYSSTAGTNTYQQALELGITGDFEFRVVGNYQSVTSTNTYPSGAVTTTQSNGFDNPSFAAVWRFLDEKDHPFNWDLMGSYVPNLIKNEAASVSQTGTVARGGDTTTFGTALSYEAKSFTAYLEGTAEYLGNRSILNQANNVTTSTDASWEYILDLSTQTRFSDQWSLNAGLSETFEDNADASFTNTKGNLISFVEDPGDVTALTGALNYQPMPGRICASFIYTHDFLGNNGDTYTTQTTSNQTSTSRGDDIFSGELRYVFN